MIKFRRISQIEKLYPFMDAVIDKDALNGDFGAVTSGKFAPKCRRKIRRLCRSKLVMIWTCQNINSCWISCKSRRL